MNRYYLEFMSQKIPFHEYSPLNLFQDAHFGQDTHIFHMVADIQLEQPNNQSRVKKMVPKLKKVRNAD